MGPKEQVRSAYSPFYRVRNGTVTSLQVPYDITGDVPNASLTVPSNVGKQLNRSRERPKKKMVGLRLLRPGALATVRVQKGEIRLYRDIYIKIYIFVQIQPTQFSKLLKMMKMYMLYSDSSFQNFWKK